MIYEMSEEMISKAEQAINIADSYFYEFAKEYEKKGFVWIKHDETNQLVVYTRGEYTKEILDFLETLTE